VKVKKKIWPVRTYLLALAEMMAGKKNDDVIIKCPSSRRQEERRAMERAGFTSRKAWKKALKRKRVELLKERNGE